MAFGYKDKKDKGASIPASGLVTMLGAGTVVDGDIKLSGDVRIDGTVKGIVQGKNKVVVGEKGKILGNVFCDSLELHGKVEGNVTSGKMVRLHPTAVLQGDLIAPKFSVDMGAVFVGSSKGQKVAESENNDGKQKK